MADALFPSSADVQGQTKKAKEPETEAEVVQQERLIASLADHPAWPVFRDSVLKRCDQLERLQGADIAGLPLEEVGKRYVVAREAAQVLREELRIVDVIASTVSEQERPSGRTKVKPS